MSPSSQSAYIRAVRTDPRPQSKGPQFTPGPSTKTYAPGWPSSRRVTAASYIIPLMSGMPPPPWPSFSGSSATIASVVRMFLAIDAAF
jgi:hypothetical protein